MDSNDIKKVMEEVLESHTTASSKLHEKHHAFIDILLDERKRKQERNEKIKAQVYGWGIITMITSILSGIGYAMYHYIKHTGGH